jgi:hypothetical protein
MNIVQSKHTSYCLLIFTWVPYLGCTHVTERCGYIIWSRLYRSESIHGEYAFAGADAHSSLILNELMKLVL